MNVQELEAKLAVLEAEVRELRDTEAIKKLQRAYGFYLEHWMAEDLIDLFSDSPECTLLIAAGEFHGKEAIRRLFRKGKDAPSRHYFDPEFLHQVMQISGVIHVAPDGLTAKGRWYGFGANCFPEGENGLNPGWMNGVYEVEYIKEENIWKLLKVRWCMTFHAPWNASFVDPARKVEKVIDRPYDDQPHLKPTGAPEETLHPSGFICPFHFENPVSGRDALQGGTYSKK